MLISSAGFVFTFLEVRREGLGSAKEDAKNRLRSTLELVPGVPNPLSEHSLCLFEGFGADILALVYESDIARLAG